MDRNNGALEILPLVLHVMISRLNTILCLANHARPIHIFSQPCIRVHLGACGNSPYFKSQALLAASCQGFERGKGSGGGGGVGGGNYSTEERNAKTRDGLKMSLSKIH